MRFFLALSFLSASLISASDPALDSAVGKRNYETFSGPLTESLASTLRIENATQNTVESDPVLDSAVGKRNYETFSGPMTESLLNETENESSIENTSIGTIDNFDALTANFGDKDKGSFIEDSALKIPPPHMVDSEKDEDLIRWWGKNPAFRAHFSNLQLINSPPEFSFQSVWFDGKPCQRRFLFFCNTGKPLQQHVSMSPLRTLIYYELFACMFGFGSVYPNVDEFIEQGFIDVNRPVYEVDLLNLKPVTLAHLCFDVDCKTPSAYKTILQKTNLSSINDKSWKGQTLLHAAIERGSEEAVQAILDGGADPSIQFLHTEGTAAMMAAKRKHISILKKIALTGLCDPEVTLQMTFSLATYFFKHRIPEALLVFVHWKGYTTESRIERLKNLLMLSYNVNHAFGLSCLQILLPFRQLEPLLISRLSDFAFKGDKCSFEAVVEAGYQPPVSFNFAGKNETYLHLAIRHRRYHMIPLVMSAVSANDQLSFEQQTPVRLAMAKRDGQALITMLPFLPKQSEADWQLLEELLIFLANCGFDLVFITLAKEFKSIQHFVIRGNSLPVFFAKNGSYQMFVATLAYLSYNPHLPDPAGIVLATLKCETAQKQQLLQHYVQLYDSSANKVCEPVIRWDL